MSFSIFKSKLVLCSSETLLIFEDGDLVSLSLPKLQIDKQSKADHNLDPDSLAGITSISFSDDGSHFIVFTNRKQLCLYSTKDNTLLSNRSLIRAASKVRFTPENDVVVADKSGDAYLFSTKNLDKPGQLILGHLSMLLDILVTQDKKYVLTADRDEKIRISRFPNAYNIEAFCLGHKAFVNNISQLPGDDRLLISSGGDGEIKVWDFLEGREINSVNFMEHIPKELVSGINVSLKNLELTEDIINLPVKHMKLHEINYNKIILVLSFYESGLFLIYEIIMAGTAAEMKGSVDIKYLQTIEETEEPLETTISNGKLWILLDSGMKVYKFNNENFNLDEEQLNILEKVNESWRELRSKTNKQMFYHTLYKRKFDNIHEYQEKKKSRMKVTS